ncbi:MAG: type II secretion system F family protein [Acidobacteriota bacterium]
MLGLVALVFLVLFAVIVLTVALGWNYLEAQKKKKVSEMLQSAVGDARQVETKVLMDAAGSGEDALKQFIGRFNFAKKMETKIQQAGLTMSLNALLIQMLVLSVPGALIGAKLNPLMFRWLSAMVLGLAGATVPYLYVSRQRTKRLGAFEEQFPEALEFLSRAMRAGHAFSIALEMLSEESPQPLGNEFRKVFNEHNLGLPIETALGNLTERVPLLDVKFFVSAVLLQRETGGNLSEILTKLAAVIRERFKLKGQVKAASAHGRITGSILTIMPIALMFGLLIIAPGYLQGMIEDPDGRIMVASVIVMIFIGHLTIRKIVNIKV